MYEFEYPAYEAAAPPAPGAGARRRAAAARTVRAKAEAEAPRVAEGYKHCRCDARIGIVAIGLTA